MMFSNNQNDNNSQLNAIIQQLQIIDNKLNELKDHIGYIDTKLNIVNSSCKNMDQHIGFVENIYDIVKSPFQKILTYYYTDADSIKLTDVKRTRDQS
jgi:archaellum component FlaC